MSEHKIQAAFFEYVRWKKIKPIFAIPNGGTRNKREAVKLVREGVEKGVPDVFCAIPRGIHAGLFLEFKNGKKGRVSTDQREMLERLERRGYAVAVVRSVNEAVGALEEYLGFASKEDNKENDLSTN